MDIIINKDIKSIYSSELQNFLFSALMTIGFTLRYKVQFNQEITIKYILLLFILISIHVLSAFIKSRKSCLIKILIKNEKREISLTYSEKDNIKNCKTINFDDIRNVIFSFVFYVKPYSKRAIITANIFLKNGNAVKLEFQDLESCLQTFSQLNKNVPTETKSNKKIISDKIIKNYIEKGITPKEYKIAQKNQDLSLVFSFATLTITFFFFILT